MDDLESSGEVISQTLRELETINRLLGGNYVTTNGLQKLLVKHNPGKVIEVADLGCGGGDIMKLIAKWAIKQNLEIELVGFDANPHIIEYARENCKHYPNIRLEVQDIFSEEFKQRKFDVICCTLFTHHFTDEQLIDIFHQFRSQATTGTVINDLHRHWFAFYAIKLLTKAFSKSPMVKYDAPLSVARSFRRKDFSKILNTASIESYRLRWMWAFRWQLIF
jgi:2-polyprenyl-3-methyl-5-hydroxy-6-metoxy-1,4-benzoquinol methylase